MVFVMAAISGAARAQLPDRVMPPDFVTCERDRLSSYTGRVTAFEAGAHETTLVIATDWDTTEAVSIRHPERPDAREHYRLEGADYPADGIALTDPAAAVAQGLRATAWVCSDPSTPPVIDWATAPE